MELRRIEPRKVRTMPIRVRPLSGEAFVAYLMRVARKCSLSPGEAAELLGLRARDPYRSQGMPGTWVAGDAATRIAAATGESAEVVEAMFNRDRNPQTNLLRPQLTNGRSRFCPECLQENETWLSRWQTSWSFVCVEHQTLLRCACPECLRYPALKFQKAWSRANEDVNAASMTACGVSPGHRGCGFDLADSEALSVAGDLALVSAAALIESIGNGNLRPVFAGTPVDRDFYLQNLKDLLTLLRRIPPAQLGRPSYEADEKGHERTLAIWLPSALSLASSPDVETLTTRLTDVFRRAYLEQRIRFPRSEPKSVLLGPCFKVVAHSMPYSVHITRGPIPRPKAQARLLSRIEPHHIPSYFWEEAVDDLRLTLDIPSELDGPELSSTFSKVMREVALRDPQLDGFVWPIRGNSARDVSRSPNRWALEVIRHRNGDQAVLDALVNATEYWCIALDFPDYRTRRHQFRTRRIRQKRWVFEPQWRGVDEATWSLITESAESLGINLAEFAGESGRRFFSVIIRSKAAGTSPIDEVNKFGNEGVVQDFLQFKECYSTVLKPWLDRYLYIICDDPRQTWEYVYVRMEMALEELKSAPKGELIEIGDRRLRDVA